MLAYMFLADGFEEVEALTTADILIRAGVTVKLVKLPVECGNAEGTNEKNEGTNFGKCKSARGSHNIRIKPDLTLGLDVTKEDLLDGDCVILPGGMPGTKNLATSSDVVYLIKEYAKLGKKVAAICAAPSVLGENGLLQGKRATCFPGNEEKLLGATVESVGAVTDGNIITGKSMGSAVTFGLAVAKALMGEEAANKVEASIYRG